VAAPVVYMAPSSANVAEKVAEAEGKSHLARNVSAVQSRGYTSDEELEELDSPLTSIIDKLPSSPTVTENGKGNNHKEQGGHPTTNARYQLLREVWSMWTLSVPHVYTYQGKNGYVRDLASKNCELRKLKRNGIERF